MSDDLEKKHPGISELSEELPPTVPVKDVARTPIGVIDETCDGEVQTPILHPDGTRAGVPTLVHRKLTGAQQLRMAQCKQKPCAACSFAEFPGPGSAHRRDIERQLSFYQRKFRIWTDLTADDFVWCDEEPLTKSTNSAGEAEERGGPGGKFLGHNCRCWHRRQEDLYPDWVPGRVKALAETLTTISDRLRRQGVRGFLRAMAADLRRRSGGVS